MWAWGPSPGQHRTHRFPDPTWHLGGFRLRSWSDAVVQTTSEQMP